MDTSLQVTKLHRKVAYLTEELIALRDSQPLLEQTIKSKDKVVAEKEHALRLMEIERQNQRAELEEMERQVTQLQGFLEERSPHNSSVKIAGAEDLKDVNVTGFQAKLEIEELRREIEGLKQDLADRDSTIRQLRHSPRTARVEDTKVRELEELVSAYKEEIIALEQELDEARQQMKEDEIAQRGVVDQISVLEGVVENMERGLIAEKKLGERNVKRIRELESQLKQAQGRIEELERDEEERIRKKHTSVDRLPDSHPQKRQTVQFLEQEVEKWKRLSSLSSSAGGNGRRMSSGSGGSGESPEEVKGLKLIIEQLTRENVQVESENRRLKAKSVGSEVSGVSATSGEGALRERLEAAERERELLRSELGELEGLLESKIFREEELEKDLERLRGGHASTPPLRRKSSSSSQHRPHSMTPPSTSPPPPPTIAEEPVIDESLWCEICEEKGHDILGCRAVFGDKPAPTTPRDSSASLNANGKIGMGERRSVGYCENCDRWDHTTEGNAPLFTLS
jgi:chromosome segregation ATPase